MCFSFSSSARTAAPTSALNINASSSVLPNIHPRCVAFFCIPPQLREVLSTISSQKSLSSVRTLCHFPSLWVILLYSKLVSSHEWSLQMRSEKLSINLLRPDWSQLRFNKYEPSVKRIPSIEACLNIAAYSTYQLLNHYFLLHFSKITQFILDVQTPFLLATFQMLLSQQKIAIIGFSLKRTMHYWALKHVKQYNQTFL